VSGLMEKRGTPLAVAVAVSMAVSMTTEHAQNSAHPCEDPSRLLLEDIFSYSRVMIAFYVHSCMSNCTISITTPAIPSPAHGITT
jgi:hypothetical protein